MNRRQFVAGAVAGMLPVRPASAFARAPLVERRQIALNGAVLNMSLAGPQDGEPMIVLHGGRGYGTHGGVFGTYLPLADRYRLIGFDMRGHGGSQARGPFTFDQMVADVEAVRQEVGQGKPMVLLGGSFGGMVALSYAVAHPDGLSALILRGTAPSWQHEAGALANFEARRSRAPMATTAMLQKLFTPTIASDEEFRLIMFALAPMYAERAEDVDLDRIATRVAATRYRADVHNDLFADHSYDVVSRLSTIASRTMVFCGAEDWICPPDQSRLIAEQIPGAELNIVPKSNHGVPDATALALVTRFLAATRRLQQ